MNRADAKHSVDEIVQQFFEGYRLRQYTAGEIIVFAQDEIAPVHFLVTGLIAQYDISDQAKKNILTIYKPGAFFPMSGALTGIPNRYFFEALEPTTLRQAPAADAANFLRQNPDVANDLLVRLYRGMDGILHRMSLLMDGTAQKRLLFELGIMAERFGVRDESGHMHIAITEQQLSAQSGLARETVSRELKKLKEVGTITRKRGLITLRQT